jgi:hypothetical protein
LDLPAARTGWDNFSSVRLRPGRMSLHELPVSRQGSFGVGPVLRIRILPFLKALKVELFISGFIPPLFYCSLLQRSGSPKKELK